MDSATSLYNYVEEQAHILVQRTNASLEHLEYLLQLREMEGHFMQVCHVFLMISDFHVCLNSGNIYSAVQKLHPAMNGMHPMLLSRLRNAFSRFE